jgi:hypothetical protein
MDLVESDPNSDMPHSRQVHCNELDHCGPAATGVPRSDPLVIAGNPVSPARRFCARADRASVQRFPVRPLRLRVLSNCEGLASGGGRR